MQRKVILAMLIAAAMVLGLTGCPDGNDGGTEGDKFDFTPYVGPWQVNGMPFSMLTQNPSDTGYAYTGNAALPDPPKGWTLTVTKTGKFDFHGSLLNMDTTATGQLIYYKDEPDFFTIKPVSGYWNKGLPNEEKIDSATLAAFVGEVNRVFENGTRQNAAAAMGGPATVPAGTWIMFSDNLSMFDFVWEKK